MNKKKKNIGVIIQNFLELSPSESRRAEKTNFGTCEYRSTERAKKLMKLLDLRVDGEIECEGDDVGHCGDCACPDIDEEEVCANDHDCIACQVRDADYDGADWQNIADMLIDPYTFRHYDGWLLEDADLSETEKKELKKIQEKYEGIDGYISQTRIFCRQYWTGEYDDREILEMWQKVTK